MNGAVNSYETPLDSAEKELERFESTLFHTRDLVPVMREILRVKRQVGLVKRMLSHTIGAFVKIPTPSDASSILIQDVRENLDANLGFYAQDSWTLDRLTLNYGLRFDYNKQTIAGQPAYVGRFANSQAYDDISFPTWKDWSPRRRPGRRTTANPSTWGR